MFLNNPIFPLTTPPSSLYTLLIKLFDIQTNEVNGLNESIAVINKLMVEVFNDIIIIEETALRNGRFTDVSVAETHTVEAVGLHDRPTMGEVAKKLRITVGTLSTAAANLVKKGYIARFSEEGDRRVVRLGLTNKGRLLFRVHERFHAEMVRCSITELGEGEERVLVSALSTLHSYLTTRHINGGKANL